MPQLRLRRRPHAVRPVRQGARGGATRRPRRLDPARALDRHPDSRPRAHRRRDPRGCQPGRRRQPRRRAHGRAARRAARLGHRHHDQPALRLGPGCGDAGQPHDRDRGCRGRHRGRRRVDEPRTLGAAEAGAPLPGRQRDPGLDHARLAPDQPAASGRDRRADGRDRRAARRRVRHLARRAGRVRGARRTCAAAAAWDAGVFDGEIVAGAGRRPRPRRGRARRLDRRGARRR